MIRSLYRGDCLSILEDYIEPESVDLVYLDPPFNSKSTYNLPFKGREKTHKAVEAFKDTWTWQDKPDESGLSDNGRLEALRSNPELQDVAFLVDFARKQDTPKNSMGSYILSMTWRLRAIHRVLKPTGTVYLHCDPTANYFLRMVMDCIFRRSNFRNEVVWHYYNVASNAKQFFGRKHETVLFYSKSNRASFNWDDMREDYAPNSNWVKSSASYGDSRYGPNENGKLMHDVWRIPTINNKAHERLGYPTQKPLALLERIIKASSSRGEIVLDPFCGCGTAVHAAESLGRQWIGIDISRFSIGLITERILSNFKGVLSPTDIEISGQPETIKDARTLARQDPFEFEKWVCGKIGANGMASRVGKRGADGGIDGIIELVAVEKGEVKDKTAIVQVKGGTVTADSVRALSEVVRRSGSVLGIMVCFENRMRTVENQRGTALWSDDSGTYPVIQGFSVERLINGERPLLPPTYGRRRGGRISA